MTSSTAIFVRYERSLARVERLNAREWTDETATGKPVLCCRKCGGLTEIDDDHRIEGDRVVPAVTCATVTCGLTEYVTLGDYAAVLR